MHSLAEKPPLKHRLGLARQTKRLRFPIQPGRLLDRKQSERVHERLLFVRERIKRY